MKGFSPIAKGGIFLGMLDLVAEGFDLGAIAAKLGGMDPAGVIPPLGGIGMEFGDHGFIIEFVEVFLFFTGFVGGEAVGGFGEYELESFIEFEDEKGLVEFLAERFEVDRVFVR